MSRWDYVVPSGKKMRTETKIPALQLVSATTVCNGGDDGTRTQLRVATVPLQKMNKTNASQDRTRNLQVKTTAMPRQFLNRTWTLIRHCFVPQACWRFRPIPTSPACLRLGQAFLNMCALRF